VPERAVVRGGAALINNVPNPKYSATWSEKLDIVAATMEVINEDDATERVPEGTVVIQVEFQVSPTGDYADNIGRMLKPKFFIATASARASNANLKTMTMLSANKLNQILRAIGYEVGGTGVCYNDYFEGNNPVVVGQSVNALIRQYTNKKYDKIYDDISAFTSLEVTA
jgi:hypothetical protein